MNDTDAGLLLNKNWNRISKLDGIRNMGKLSPKLKTERSYRIHLQNCFSNSVNKTEENKFLQEIKILNDETLTNKRKLKNA